MVSGIYICHWPHQDLEYLRCEVLLHRSYHNDVPSTTVVVHQFSQAYSAQNPQERTPFLRINGISYILLWVDNDILLLAVARRNVNAMLAVSLLSQLQTLICHYFSAHKRLNSASGAIQTDSIEHAGFTRDSVIDNHALLFELLDECVDFGLPQVTDFNILKEYIKMEVNHSSKPSLDHKASGDSHDSWLDSDLPVPLKSSKAKKTRKNDHKKTLIKSTHNQAVRTDVLNDAAANYINSSIVRTQVSSISWRPTGIFYPKNDIYIDIMEECEFLYDLETQTVRSNHITGACLVKSYLSGMPVCKLGLNEKYISQVEYDGSSDFEEEYADNTEDRAGNQLQNTQQQPDEPEEPEDIEEPQKPQKALSAGHNYTVTNTPRLMKVPITNVQFHLCVELSRVYKENLIFFTPPDGEFRLFSYSVEQQRRKRTQPLLVVRPTYRVLSQQKKLQIMCSLHTSFRKKLHCNKVIVKLPINPALFPLDNSSEDNFQFKCEMGEVRFSVDSSEIFWAIGDLPGSKKCVKLMAEFRLSHCGHLSEECILAELFGRPQKPVENGKNGEDIESRDSSTISELDKYYNVGKASSSVFQRLQQNATRTAHEMSVSFEVPMFTYSGMKIIDLRVDEDIVKYTCFPWVRYTTRASLSKSGVQKLNLGGNPAAAKFRYKSRPSNFTIV